LSRCGFLETERTLVLSGHIQLGWIVESYVLRVHRCIQLCPFSCLVSSQTTCNYFSSLPQPHRFLKKLLMPRAVISDIEDEEDNIDDETPNIARKMRKKVASVSDDDGAVSHPGSEEREDVLVKPKPAGKTKKKASTVQTPRIGTRPTAERVPSVKQSAQGIPLHTGLFFFQSNSCHIRKGKARSSCQGFGKKGQKVRENSKS